jgi:23S rRNA (cytosine1962-C5)-methyltransferase
MILPILRLKSGREESVARGHPWIFSGALRAPLPKLDAGTLVEIQDGDGSFLARGYYHPGTDIAVRVLTRRSDRGIDTELFVERIRAALALRAPLANTDTNAYRLVNAEGDFLPGLIVDRYDDILVLQVSTAGMEQLIDQVIEALRTVVQPAGILLRNDVSVRTREGLEREHPRIAWGEVPPLVPIRENGMRFDVDVWRGQKTGFFLDQRDKRQALRRYARGKTVLNTFSYTGGFGIAAMLAGATLVTNVDQSGPVIAQAREQMRLNEIDPDVHEFLVGDAFAYLERWVEEQRTFDIVILDPPAFAKSIKDRGQAMRAYRRLNTLGLQVLSPGGMLVTCSCSGSITLEEFRIVVGEAGERANRPVQTAETFEHGLDHPVLLAMPESRYLKALFCRAEALR